MQLKPGLAALAFCALAVGPALAADSCKLTPIGEIPVTMMRLQPTVPVQINGRPGRLTLDTGAFFSMLGPGSAQRFGLKVGMAPMGVQVMGVGGEANVGFTTAKDFTIAGATFHDADFFVGEHQFGPSDGLLGANFLTEADIEFDFANGVIRFFREDHCDGASLAYWTHDNSVGLMDLTRFNRTPTSLSEEVQTGIMGTATLNGAHIRIKFDTGDARSVLSLRAAARAGIKTDSPGVVPGGEGIGVDRRPVVEYLAPFQSFVIGGEQVQSTHLRLADMALEDTDMLLGTDFFLSHRIFVSVRQSRLFFTYNGGPVFDLGVAKLSDTEQASNGAAATSGGSSATPGPLSNQPTDMAGFMRQGAAFEARREFDQAIGAYTQASALAPTDAAPLVARGQAHVLNRQPFKALDDLNQALKLNPSNVQALMLRGQLRLIGKDIDDGKADFAAALKIDAGLQPRIAGDYLRAGLFEDGLASFDAWIATDPKGAELASALAGRCRARALLGRDLDQATDDCKQALKLAPGNPIVLSSRGLVELRQGQADAAIADFNAMLLAQPRDAWALYGRGLAKAKKGDKPSSDTDLSAAVAIQPSIAAQAKSVGLAP